MPKLKRVLISTIPPKNIVRLAKGGEKLLTQEYDAELYHRILRSSRSDISSDDFIEQIYEMLVAFKMNSRGAKLAELPDFKKAIKKHADTIQSLAKVKLEKVKATDDAFTDTIGTLFCNLDGLTQTRSTLVTFSKTMHFLLPDLFMPIDRKFTLQFYYSDLPFKNKCAMQNVINTREKQKKCLSFISEDFRRYAREHCEVLSEQIKSTSPWNRNIPKVIDNIIIAYVSEKMG